MLSVSLASQSAFCAQPKACSGLDPAAVRKQFPIFANHPDLVFLDNASTSQKPSVVLDEINRYYAEQCANAGRATYSWSTQLERAMAGVRAGTAEFIGAEPEDLSFTGGATESLNTVAMAWGLHNLQDGDEVMLCTKDHKSAVMPWYNLKEILAYHGKNIEIKTFEIHEVGDYDLKSIKELVSPRTRVLCMAHIHHVFGLDMEVAEIRRIVGPNVAISLDASQSVGHIQVDATALDVDFLSFSGHKMFASTGVGGLWVHPRRKAELHPCKVGGQSSSVQSSILEAGTANIAGILSLGKAVQFIKSIGLDNIQSHVSDLTVYLYSRLRNLPGIVFAPGMGVCRCESGFGIISFRFEQIANIDLAFLLDAENIFVRAGDHCTTIKDASEEYIRVSMHLYNSGDDVDRLVTILQEAIA